MTETPPVPGGLGGRRTYAVSVPAFEGPLDLLLHLIEREKLDITAISLVQVTDQYLAHMQALGPANGDMLADFLVIAARLILIKSQALLPRPPAPAEAAGEEDPAEELARQLREYRRFKQVAQGLGAREAERLRSFVRVAKAPRLPAKLDLEDLALDDLLAAVQRALAVAPPAPPAGEMVRAFSVTVREQAELILRLAGEGRRFSFEALLGATPSRLEIIVTFLALLELLKRKRVRVRQEGVFGEIGIEPAPDGGDAAPLLLDEDEWGEEAEETEEESEDPADEHAADE